jgi:hypothetical protein
MCLHATATPPSKFFQNELSTAAQKHECDRIPRDAICGTITVNKVLLLLLLPTDTQCEGDVYEQLR